MIETEVYIMNMIEEEIIHLTLLFKNSRFKPYSVPKLKLT